MPLGDLTDQQEVFAQAVARGVPARQAAIQAGWSEGGAGTTGHRLSKRPEIVVRVREIREDLGLRREEALAEVEMPTRQLVLRELLEVAAVAKEGRQLQSQLRAIELIGKELGMFVQRTEIKVENPLATLSPAALLELSRLLEASEEPLLVEGEVLEHDALSASDHDEDETLFP